MTQQEWEAATIEQRAEEYERCKDPVYFYNTYCMRSDGIKPPPITKEQWDAHMKFADDYQVHRFGRRRYSQPEISLEVGKLPEYLKPKSS